MDGMRQSTRDTTPINDWLTRGTLAVGTNALFHDRMAQSTALTRLR